MLNYYLKRDATNYYKVINGSPIYNNTKTAVSSIINWDKFQPTWVRHERYHGIFKKQLAKDTEMIQFCFDAATILRWLFNTQGGVMAQCSFVLELEINGGVEEIFDCPIDFATYNSTRDYVEVGVMQSELNAYIDAYESVKADIPINLTTGLLVNMDGKDLFTQYRYLITVGSGGTINTTPFFRNSIQMAFARQNGDFTVGFAQTITDPFPAPPAPPFFQSDYTTVAKITYAFDFQITSVTGADNTFQLRCEVWDGQPDTGSLISTDFLFTSGTIVAGGTYNFPVSGIHTVTLAAGYSVIFRIQLTNLGVTSGFAWTNTVEHDFVVDCTTNSGAGTSKGYRYHVALRKLIEFFTGGLYSLRIGGYLEKPGLIPQSYAGATPYNCVLTSEQALKGIVDVPYLSVSLNQLRQDLLLMNAAIGTENNELIVEELEYFYNKAITICTFDNINEVAFKPADNYIFNGIKVGYDSFDAIDDLNKKNSFNGTNEFTLGIRRFLSKDNNMMELVSSFSADPNDIEQTRAQNYDASTKRNRINNTQKREGGKTYALQISGFNGTSWNLDRSLFVYDVPDAGTTYNAGRTPKRCLMRMRRLLKSIVSLIPDKKLKFASAQGNKDIRTWDGGPTGVIKEADDIDLSTMQGQLLFYPIIMTFKAVIPSGFATAMENNPYGVMKVQYIMNGVPVEVQGFVLSAGYNLAKGAAVEIEMLLSPDTDLSKLVY